MRVRVQIGLRSWVQGAGAVAGKVRETGFHFSLAKSPFRTSTDIKHHLKNEI